MLRSAAVPLVALLLAGPTALAGCGRDPERATAPTRATTAARDAPPVPEPTLQIDRLTGSSTKVTLDPGFLAAVRSARLRLVATGRAELAGGVLTLPVTGGNVTYYRPGTASPSFQGRVEHMGSGLALVGTDRRVALEGLVLDPARGVLTGSVSSSGMTVTDDGPLLAADASALGAPRRSVDRTRVALEGLRLRLGRSIAGLLGETFTAGTLRPGLVVGTAKLTLDLDAPPGPVGSVP